MYNLRYHIASLVAVFLSLSIGLLLGTIIVERGTLDRQREAIVHSLQQEFRTLDADNRELRAALAEQEDLAASLLQAAVAGELENRTVLILASTGRVDGLSSTIEVIRDAGGTPVTMVLLSPSFGVGDAAVSSVATAVIGPVEPDALLTDMVATLVDEWSVPGEDRPLTDALAGEGAVRVDGDVGADTVADGVVVLASFAGSPDDGALAFAAALADRDLPACGVETQTHETGVAEAALEAGLSGIDNIGTPEGAFSLTWVLSGRASGYFGVGSAAQAPWPR